VQQSSAKPRLSAYFKDRAKLFESKVSRRMNTLHLSQPGGLVISCSQKLVFQDFLPCKIPMKTE